VGHTNWRSAFTPSLCRVPNSNACNPYQTLSPEVISVENDEHATMRQEEYLRQVPHVLAYETDTPVTGQGRRRAWGPTLAQASSARTSKFGRTFHTQTTFSQ